MSTITSILNQLCNGEPVADNLLPLIYRELRQLAGFRLRNAPTGQTLQPTALVHEAFLRLSNGRQEQRWDNRGHFFSAAAEAMRHILVEHARRRKSLKRGGNKIQFAEIEEHAAINAFNPDDVLDLDAVLSKLSASDPELARLVELRFFAGLTIEETAEALKISPRTVKRNWAFARAWLGRELGLQDENAE